jgi:8-oxo-dGTP diphosphatase
MADLLSKSAKICLTAAGCLIHQGKVLLVKHKKVKTWLNPGGHIEENEAPHQAAEREFWEETGVKVRAIDNAPINAIDNSQYLPDPFATNLHWISIPNYEARLANTNQKEAVWSKGCEQHLNFMYLVEPVDGTEFTENVEETDGIAWFSPSELKKLDLFPNVKQEIALAFKLYNQLHSK